MKKRPRKLKLSKETLHRLTGDRLLYIKGGISGQPIDGCGETNGYQCPSDPLLNACTPTVISNCTPFSDCGC